MNNLDPRDYVYLWSNFNESLFNLSLRTYGRFRERDLVLIYDPSQKEIKFYLSKKDCAEISDDCATFYINSFDTWKVEFVRQMQEIDHLVKESHAQEAVIPTMSTEGLKAALSARVAIVQHFCSEYMYYTNFYSVETSERLIAGDPQRHVRLKNVLEELGTLKYKAREYLNIVLSFELFRSYLGEIGRRFNRTDIEWLLPHEIMSLLEGVDVPLTRRESDFHVMAHAFAWKLISADKAENMSNSFDAIFFRQTDSDVIKGVTASKGVHRGIVKVVRTLFTVADVAQEIAKVQQGDVLVSSTTGPEIMAACQRAGAIVTNEGGITSHAAVVSRELGIPCIIGTKNGDKLLKDGDLVEVDADHGIVKILKRAV